MTVLLYAVAGSALDPTGIPSLYKRPLRVLAHDGLSAVVSDLDTPLPPDSAHLWAYHEVVMRLMAATPLLPARFGTTADEDREIERMLVERRAEFVGSLARVGDRVEYAVSLPPPTLEPPAPSGTAYMERLQRRERCHRALEGAGQSLVREARRTAHGTAYLVERERADTFVTQAGALGLTVVGPWPPYSFVRPT